MLTPFTLAGAMAPVTIAGALAQQNAEALAGIALRPDRCGPGAPVVYGGFTSNVDMKSGAPAFGTPEYMKAALVGGQLARRYRLPYRTSNTNAANAVDAQAAYESVFSLWGAVMGGGNFVMHGAGWMEGGPASPPSRRSSSTPTCCRWSPSSSRRSRSTTTTLALDAIREVGPGGHFFGCAHTLARYRTAFYAPMISDWRNYETWREAGSPDADQRARLCEALLAEYQPPPLDPAIREELDAFVARRKAEGGAPPPEERRTSSDSLFECGSACGSHLTAASPKGALDRRGWERRTGCGRRRTGRGTSRA